MIMSENHKPVIVVDADKVLVDIEPDAVLQELSIRCRREIRLPLPGVLESLFSQVYVGKRSWGAILSLPLTVFSDSRSGSRNGIYSGAES